MVEPLFVGKSVFDFDHVEARVRNAMYHLGVGNQLTACLAGINVALYDAIARGFGVRVCDLIGGCATRRIPAYASTGFFTITTTATDHPSSATAACQVLIFAFAPGGGSFVVGDHESAVGTSVTFWGAQWWKLNGVSGGAAPAAFKGFADSPATPSCGTGWSTGPGDSPKPPSAPLPAFMGMIVSSSISKSGSSISGDTPHIVVVQTNPGYDTNPGHAGTGMVVAQLC